MSSDAHAGEQKSTTGESAKQQASRDKKSILVRSFKRTQLDDAAAKEIVGPLEYTLSVSEAEAAIAAATGRKPVPRKKKKRVEHVLLTRANGRSTRLTEVTDADGTYLVEVDSADGNVYQRQGNMESIIWNRTRENKPDKSTKFYGRITRIGSDTVRYHDIGNHQIDTRHGDGSRKLELLTEIIRMDAQGVLVPVEVPEFTIRWRNVSGLVHLYEDSWTRDAEEISVTDRFGGCYKLSSEYPEFRLSRDVTTGNLSFIDRNSRQVIIKPDGSREVWAERGKGAGTKFDRGGRKRYEYSKPDTPAFNGFFYGFHNDGRVSLTRYFTRNGDWKWLDNDRATGKQRWQLQNAKSGQKPIKLFNLTDVNRRNAVIVVNDYVKTTYCQDGTVVVHSQFYMNEEGDRAPLIGKNPKGRATVSETSVAEGSKAPAYQLTTYRNAAGRIVQQELQTKDGIKHIRGGEGHQYESRRWRSVDKSGTPLNGDQFVGEIAIDEDGTLVRRAYLLRPIHASSDKKPSPTKKRTSEQSTLVIEKTTYLHSNGESEEVFEHGGTVFREQDGEVLLVRYPLGREIRFHFATEVMNGDSRQLVGFRMNDQYWRFQPQTLTFAPDPADAPYGDAQLKIAIDRNTAEVTISNLLLGEVTRLQIDGTTHIERNDGSRRSTAADGRLKLLVDASSNEMRFEYENQGRLVRIDTSFGVNVCSRDYQATPERPVAENAIRAKTLNVESWRGQCWAAFVDDSGRRTRISNDETIEHYETIDKAEKLVGAVLPGGRAYVLEGHRRTGEVATEVSKLEPFRGETPDRFLTFTTLDGERVEQALLGWMRRFDKLDRLVECSGRYYSHEFKYTFQYASTENSILSKVVGTNLELIRDSKTGERSWRKKSTVKLRDFRWDALGNLVIEPDDSEVSEPACVIVNPTTGTRFVFDRRGTFTEFDALGRERNRRTLTGDKSYMFYDGEDLAPKKPHAGVSSFIPANDTLPEWKGKPPVIDHTILDGRLTEFKKTVQTDPRQTVIVSLKQNADGVLTDNLGNQYAFAHYDKKSGDVLLASPDWKTWRLIEAKRGEIEVHRDSAYRVICQIRRTESQSVSKIYAESPGMLAIMNVFDNLDGTTVLTRGNSTLIGSNTVALFEHSNDPNHPIFARIEVDRQGGQMWKAQNGLSRIVRADGTVEILRPNDFRTVFSPTADRIRHTMPPGSELREVIVHRSGDVELHFTDGRYWRHPASSKSIFRSASLKNAEERPFFERNAITGRVKVSRDGDATVVNDTAGTITAYQTSGDVEQFKMSQNRWQAPDGSFFEDRHAVLDYLSESDLTAGDKTNIAVDPRDAVEVTLFERGLEFLKVRHVQPQATPDGGQRWAFTTNVESDEKLTGREGLPPGHRVEEIIRHKEGGVSLKLVESEMLQLDSGSCIVHGGSIAIAPEIPDSVSDSLLWRAVMWAASDARIAPRALAIVRKAAAAGNNRASSELARLEKGTGTDNSPVKLQFDGVYAQRRSAPLDSEYLRFYPDGVVASLSSRAKLEKIERLTRKTSALIDAGKYNISDGVIRFSLSGGKIEYECDLDGDSLNVSFESRITKRSGKYTLQFLRFPKN